MESGRLPSRSSLKQQNASGGRIRRKRGSETAISGMIASRFRRYPQLLLLRRGGIVAVALRNRHHHQQQQRRQEAEREATR